MLKKGFINIYRSGFFHRLAKPCCIDRHGGDIYETEEEAKKDIDPPTHYVATVPIEWDDTEDVRKNPADSIPVPLSESRKLNRVA